MEGVDRRNFLKLAVAEITKKVVGSITSNINIFPAIVVIVCHGNAHSPAACRETRSLSHILEMTPSIAPIKSTNDIPSLTETLDSRAAHEKNIQVPIVVIIKESGPTPHGLNDVLLGQTSLDILEAAEPRFPSNIHKYRASRAS